MALVIQKETILKLTRDLQTLGEDAMHLVPMAPTTLTQKPCYDFVKMIVDYVEAVGQAIADEQPSPIPPH
jgi:hypothetical protein